MLSINIHNIPRRHEDTTYKLPADDSPGANVRPHLLTTTTDAR